MNEGFIILWMIFFHIVDDYYLQGWLASAKQKSWWEKNAPDKMYENDYIWALMMHSFSWTFMIMLPIAYFNGFAIDPLFFMMFVSNVMLHAIVDNLKANEKWINLWFDQIVHMIQILLTFVVLILV